MLKMTVRPLAIRNSNMPNRTPLSVDMTISSSKTLRRDKETHPPPKVFRGGRVTRERSVRPFHLAGGRKHGRGRIDLRNELPAPPGLLLVERFLFGAITERGNIDRLEAMAMGPAHGAFGTLGH